MQENAQLVSAPKPTDLSEHSFHNVPVPYAVGGGWSFTTFGSVIEHASYKAVSHTSGYITPIFGLSMSSRGSGGGYVAGGGGLISSRTAEWCRLVARKGDGRTFSTEGACELALQQGSQLLHSAVRIGGSEREFLLFNPESGVSQLKVTVDDLSSIRTYSRKVYLWYLLAIFCLQLGGIGVLFGLVFAAIPSWIIYQWWLSRREYLATKAQIDEGIAMVAADFRERLQLV